MGWIAACGSRWLAPPASGERYRLLVAFLALAGAAVPLPDLVAAWEERLLAAFFAREAFLAAAAPADEDFRDV
jgi:hypothetical protein